MLPTRLSRGLGVLGAVFLDRKGCRPSPFTPLGVGIADCCQDISRDFEELAAERDLFAGRVQAPRSPFLFHGCGRGLSGSSPRCSVAWRGCRRISQGCGALGAAPLGVMGVMGVSVS